MPKFMKQSMKGMPMGTAKVDTAREFSEKPQFGKSDKGAVKKDKPDIDKNPPVKAPKFAKKGSRGMNKKGGRSY